MAGIKISALPAVPSAQLTDVFPAVQTATTFKESNQQLLTLFQANGDPLTEVNDTNVTMTLGGMPTIALLNATSMTLGWTGTLAVGRGGLGIGTTPTNGQIPIGNGTNYVASTITAGTGISITNGAGSISIASNGFSNFVDQMATTVTMAINTTYLCDAGASLITFTLPPTSVIDSWIQILGNSAGGWTIAQTAGQVIKVSPATTTVGVGGSLSSQNQFDSVILRCVAANTGWSLTSQQSAGLTIV